MLELLKFEVKFDELYSFKKNLLFNSCSVKKLIS